MKALFAAALLAGSVATFGYANAMPLTGAPAPGVNADVIQVAGGCGPGMHRGPRGGCLRNWARPALHAKKVRDLELKAGHAPSRGQTTPITCAAIASRSGAGSSRPRPLTPASKARTGAANEERR